MQQNAECSLCLDSLRMPDNLIGKLLKFLNCLNSHCIYIYVSCCISVCKDIIGISLVSYNMQLTGLVQCFVEIQRGQEYVRKPIHPVVLKYDPFCVIFINLGMVLYQYIQYNKQAICWWLEVNFVIIAKIILVVLFFCSQQFIELTYYRA